MTTKTARLPGRDRGYVTRLRDATEDNSAGLSLSRRSLGSNSGNLTQKVFHDFAQFFVRQLDYSILFKKD